MKQLLAMAAVAALALTACNKANSPAVGSGAAAQGSATSLTPDTVVATYDGQKVTLGELDASLAKELYEMRRQALETMILRKLVDAEAKKVGKTEEDFLKDVAEQSAKPASDAELQKIYEEHKDAFGGKSFEDVKPMLAQRQNQQKQQDAVMAYLDKLKERNKVEIILPEPRAEVAAVGPARGPDNAPVTIVEFSDFQCPYCAKAKKTAEEVVSNYAGKVRLVFRDFPLPFHDKAGKAAEAGLCANEQGKFWQMHDQMFDHQDKLAVPELKEAAKTLGLDSSKFDQCLDSGKFAQKVAENVDAGKKAGVSGTPAFFINGRMLSGALPYDEFKKVVDEELKAKN